jgi:hypothetical protein
MDAVNAWIEGYAKVAGEAGEYEWVEVFEDCEVAAG